MKFNVKIVLVLLSSIISLWPAWLFAQVTLGTENGEWRYIGGTIGHTRYSPLNQINATNFNDLEQAWIWRTDNYGPNVDSVSYTHLTLPTKRIV